MTVINWIALSELQKAVCRRILEKDGIYEINLDIEKDSAFAVTESQRILAFGSVSPTEDPTVLKLGHLAFLPGEQAAAAVLLHALEDVARARGGSKLCTVSENSKNLLEESGYIHTPDSLYRIL